MTIHCCWAHRGNRRRALVAVQVAVLLIVILGFGALSVDVGSMYNVRADLQRAADAAALAGVSVYTTDDMMRIRQGATGESAIANLMLSARAIVDDISPLNPSYGSPLMVIEPYDMAGGWIDLTSGKSPIQQGGPAGDFLALQVVTRRTSDATNGPIEYFFAPVLGISVGNVTATAVAVFDDRFSGIRVTPNGANLLPFTIHEDAFAQELAQGGDQYAYNEAAGVIDSASDGIREIRLYPYPLSGSGYEEGDGNFGVLNIGTGNQGVPAEVVQIANGITPEDAQMEVGTSELTFYDDSGAPTDYDISGSPGLEATLKAAIGTRVGDVVGFFLHNNVVLSGSNAIYTITQIRYGRVMAIKLTGPPNGRGLYIQPVSYAGGEIIVHEDSPRSGGLVGRIMLAR